MTGVLFFAIIICHTKGVIIMDKEFANPWKKSEQAKINMSVAANKKWASDIGKLLKEKLSRLTAEKMASGKLRRSHSGYFFSKKMNKNITWFSTYELRAIWLCENDPQVTEYETCFYYNINGRDRVGDLLINKKHLKEIKPQIILDKKYPKVELQIQDGKDFANVSGYTFETWSEKELKVKDYFELLDWSDTIRKQLYGMDNKAIRKARALERQKKYYKKNIQNNKIDVFCKYCNKHHTVLRLVYERDIKNKEDYICHLENAKRVGRLPKDHLKKDNPYASDGKKQCNECKGVKLFEEFSPDKSKRDGYSTRCKICRAAKYKAKYQEKKGSDSQSSIESK